MSAWNLQFRSATANENSCCATAGCYAPDGGDLYRFADYMLYSVHRRRICLLRITIRCGAFTVIIADTRSARTSAGGAWQKALCLALSLSEPGQSQNVHASPENFHRRLQVPRVIVLAVCYRSALIMGKSRFPYSCGNRMGMGMYMV